MPVGTLFSLCAGILIGLKLYNKQNFHMSDRTKRVLKELWYGSGWKQNG